MSTKGRINWTSVRLATAILFVTFLSAGAAADENIERKLCISRLEELVLIIDEDLPRSDEHFNNLAVYFESPMWIPGCTREDFKITANKSHYLKSVENIGVEDIAVFEYQCESAMLAYDIEIKVIKDGSVAYDKSCW